VYKYSATESNIQITPRWILIQIIDYLFEPNSAFLSKTVILKALELFCYSDCSIRVLHATRLLHACMSECLEWTYQPVYEAFQNSEAFLST